MIPGWAAPLEDREKYFQELLGLLLELRKGIQD
jgi:hypothetical protein